MAKNDTMGTIKSHHLLLKIEKAKQNLVYCFPSNLVCDDNEDKQMEVSSIVSYANNRFDESFDFVKQ